MNQTRTIRLPIHVVKELNVYLRAARELTQKLDHEPSPEEIANLLEKPVGEVKRMLGLNERVSSVDVSLGPDSDKTLLDTLTDDRPTDPCELLQDDDLSQSIDQWLSELTEKQREVVIRRFGLRGHESSTLEDVGLEIGLTRERVRQIQVEGLKRLREILEKTACPASLSSSNQPLVMSIQGRYNTECVYRPFICLSLFECRRSMRLLGLSAFKACKSLRTVAVSHSGNNSEACRQTAVFTDLTRCFK